MSAAMTLASCGGTKDAGQQQKIHVAVVQQLRTRQQCPAQQRNNAEQQHHPPQCSRISRRKANCLHGILLQRAPEQE